MKKEIAKHLVVVNGTVVGELLNTEVAKILVEALTNKLANEKNVDVRYVKQTSEIDIPDPKPEAKANNTTPKTEASKADAKKPVKSTEEDLKKKN